MKPGHHFAQDDKVRNTVTNATGAIAYRVDEKTYAVKWDDGTFSRMVSTKILARVPTAAPQRPPLKRVELL